MGNCSCIFFEAWSLRYKVGFDKYFSEENLLVIKCLKAIKYAFCFN